MDDEQVFCAVNDEVARHPWEMHENRVYSVSDASGGRVDKAALKRRFVQGDWGAPHSEVMVTVGDGVQVTVQNSPMYIYGEYVKMSRNMTQTPLRIEGRLKCDRSVSDFKEQIKELLLADDVTFIPAGREDFDVRMVGGRPFLLVVRNPRRNLGFGSVELRLHEGLGIRGLCVVTRGCKDAIFRGEAQSTKAYSVLLCCRKELVLQESYAVQQRTPLRVLHRRANMVREKRVRVVSHEKREADGWMYYLLVLEASAGTYIKEFVNGDLGRTVPSLGSAGNYCDLLELDVLSVETRSIDEFVVRRIEVRAERQE